MDTGAEVSMIPLSVARTVGAWLTGQNLTVTGVHGQAKTLPLGLIYIYFPSLNNIGGEFPIVISDVDQGAIIGMDIMVPLGISIDTKSQQVSVKNEAWEAFSKLAGYGVLVWAGIKALEAISEKE